MVVDGLRAVVGVDSQHAERAVGEQDSQRRDQIGLADLIDAGDDRPLGGLIDGGDGIETLVTVPIAWMDRVDAQITGAAGSGSGSGAVCDRWRGCAGGSGG